MVEPAIQKIISQSSVKLTKNAKGGYQWEIKCYDEDIKFALERCIAVDQRLIGLYGGERK